MRGVNPKSLLEFIPPLLDYRDSSHGSPLLVHNLSCHDYRGTILSVRRKIMCTEKCTADKCRKSKYYSAHRGYLLSRSGKIPNCNFTYYRIKILLNSGYFAVRVLSEAFAQDADDVFGLSHGIEMNRRHAVGQKILALRYAPVCPYLVYGFPVSACGTYFSGQFHRNVDYESNRGPASRHLAT